MVMQEEKDVSGRGEQRKGGGGWGPTLVVESINDTMGHPKVVIMTIATAFIELLTTNASGATLQGPIKSKR